MKNRILSSASALAFALVLSPTFAEPSGDRAEAAHSLQARIDAAAAAGGGVVTVASGVHELKPIVLRSGVTLRLERGAVLLASTNLEDCDLDTDDDAIVFKTESDPSFPVENVTVRNCRLASCCNFIKFGTGSYGTWRNILVENCRLRRAGASWRFDWRKRIPGVTERVTGLSAIALEVVDGGRMEDVTVRNISWTEGVQTPLFIRFDRRHEPAAGRETCFRNVLVENVTGTAESRLACSVTGVPGRELGGVTLRNLDLTFPGGGTAAEAAAPVREAVGEYPDPYMFDDGALPAWGIYFRHASGVRLEKAKLRLKPGATDARPMTVGYGWCLATCRAVARTVPGAKTRRSSSIMSARRRAIPR